MNSLGDFFLKLGIQTDKESVETANKNIDSVSNSLNRLMGTMRNAAAVAAIMKGIQGSAADSSLAYSMKIGTEALNNWRTAVKLSGQDASAFISKVADLDTKFRKLSIDGTFDKNLAEKLGLLKLNYGEMADMTADERTRVIYEAAQVKYQEAGTQKEKDQVAVIVGDILGGAGRGLFEYMVQSGKSIEYLLSRSKGAIFTPDDDGKATQDFREEFQLIKSSIESLGKLFGNEISKSITPYIKDLNKWIADNREQIKTTIEDVTASITTLANGIKPVFELLRTPLQRLGGIASGAVSGIHKITEGDYKGAAKDMILGPGFDLAVAKYKNTFRDATDADAKYGITVRLRGSSAKLLDGISRTLGLMTDEEYEAWWGKKGIMAQVNSTKKINDGIVRPDGVVTQVAPDDWVLAARDMGDLAAAFQPEETANIAGQKNTPEQVGNKAPAIFDNSVFKEITESINKMAAAIKPQIMPHSAGPVEVLINQSFTISGSNDIPQVIKQQAYKGTYDGLSEVISRAGTRMQLMPGLK